MCLGEEKRCSMFIIVSASLGRQVLSLISSTSVTEVIKNCAKHTASALRYFILTDRDCEGLTDYGVIMTDNGYDLSISVKCIIKECQFSKILFKSLKLACLSSKRSHL